jgi:hypothetical protein
MMKITEAVKARLPAEDFDGLRHMRVVAEDQVGTRPKRRLGHSALIIRDDARHEMDPPMQGQHDRLAHICSLLISR